jgi:Ca-activated chloride channel homolog
MKAILSTLFCLAWLPSLGIASTIVLPKDPLLPPLRVISQRAQVDIEDQTATTRIDFQIKNESDRALEATLHLPIPRGATVNDFKMSIDGKEQGGELLDSKHARQVYTDIVRRIQDPGLLEYLDSQMVRVKIFPVPARSVLPCSIRYRGLLTKEGDVVEYVLPMRGVSEVSLEFAVDVNIRSSSALQSAYSPSHGVDIERRHEKEWKIRCRQDRITSNRDFQLFFSQSTSDVGLSMLFHRPVASEDGYYMLLASPQNRIFERNRTPRDVVLVLDTSGSMDEVKMDQAKRALKSLLSQLRPEDRFGMIRFATSVDAYRDRLTDITEDQKNDANRWIDQLRAGGGTAIQPALEAALNLRSSDRSRPFVIVFMTDGQPTIGETRPEKILQLFDSMDRSSIRVFPYGVGNDVNTVFLDRLADMTRAEATFVRPGEDIERKVSTLFARLSNPAITDVKLETDTGSIRFSERYPTQMPDLFKGSQLITLGKYSGHGSGKIRLRGNLAGESVEIDTVLEFPQRTDGSKDFVPYLWAMRKISFLLDQIRKNGESTEVVKELTELAKRHGIATPYTSYLVVPDQVIPGPGLPPRPIPMPRPNPNPWRIIGARPGSGPIAEINKPMQNTTELAKELSRKGAESLGEERLKFEKDRFNRQAEGGGFGGRGASDTPGGAMPELAQRAKNQLEDLESGRRGLESKKLADAQSGKSGVDLANQSKQLRENEQSTATARQTIMGRNLLEIQGVWLDEGYDGKSVSIEIKTFSEGYFELLRLQPELKTLFSQGSRIVFRTPSGIFLILDPNRGDEKVTEGQIKQWFIK